MIICKTVENLLLSDFVFSQTWWKQVEAVSILGCATSAPILLVRSDSYGQAHVTGAVRTKGPRVLKSGLFNDSPAIRIRK
jgi:hypothetical protein